MLKKTENGKRVLLGAALVTALLPSIANSKNHNQSVTPGVLLPEKILDDQVFGTTAEIRKLDFDRDGGIRFKLVGEVGSSTKNICKSSQPEFHIAACPANETHCQDGVKRMGSMLMAAYLSRKAITIRYLKCSVITVGFEL